MDAYITGKVIKELREKNNMTQLDLANLLNVSDKTISKWETNRGLPDISLIEPLSHALKVSVIELMNGKCISNSNVSSNMLKSNIYVCPICGNVIHMVGSSIVSCCGINLPTLIAEEDNFIHQINIESIEDEYYVSIDHEMSKTHYISFIAYVTNDRFDFVKLYPEQNACARFFKRGRGYIYAFCNKDGLFIKKI